jgi:DNA polymerase III epsilon subunit-like protein
MKPAKSLISADGNIIASVDLETTGLVAGFHEVVQVAVVPLNSNLEPDDERGAFYIDITPEHPERMDAKSMEINKLTLEHLQSHGVSRWKAADLLDEYFEGLKIPLGKRLVPLAHNFAFESAHLQSWLGVETFEHIWAAWAARDTMTAGAFINDCLAMRGSHPMFPKLSLTVMTNTLNILNVNPHDALADALAGAELYRQLILMLNR